MIEDEASFLRRRAEEEALLVRVAVSPEAAAAHAQLAAAYLARHAAMNLSTSPAIHDETLQTPEPDTAGKVIAGIQAQARQNKD